MHGTTAFANLHVGNEHLILQGKTFRGNDLHISDGWKIASSHQNEIDLAAVVTTGIGNQMAGVFPNERIANDEVIHLSKVQDLMSIDISCTIPITSMATIAILHTSTDI